MPAARLSDSQKAELVDRFRAGEGLQPLAEAYGCSPNTVSRVVKAALAPGEYEQLKEQQQRSRRSPGGTAPNPPQLELLAEAASETAAASGASSLQAEPAAVLLPALGASPSVAPPPAEATPARMPPPAAAAPANPSPAQAGPSVLAIEDADDFSEDETDDDGADDDDLQDDSDGDAAEALAFVPVPLLEVVDDHTEIRPLPLKAADLSGSAWMLVDKTVELQARPLSEFTELGRLPPDEQDRQALLVFVNPRQAKRQCGRTQRVIKIPDTTVLTRTAPYLLAQGISRVVIEGALFALPGS